MPVPRPQLDLEPTKPLLASLYEEILRCYNARVLGAGDAVDVWTNRVFIKFKSSTTPYFASRKVVKTERVSLQENNYQEWASYGRNELLARGLWDIVQGITERPRTREVPESPLTTTSATAGPTTNSATTRASGASAAADILARVQARMAAVNETTPEPKDAVYLTDFQRYLIQRENYIEDVGKATAEIERSIHPSLRKQYDNILYDSAPSLLWQQIEQDRKGIAKIDASAGLFKLNAIRRVDFDSPSAYHFEILDIATEVRNSVPTYR
ncbi:hypothetical protein FN846DRAFT_894767 [Sphaerosporella brunnea]|uniref:Uncharacterized protein n=1 Tax=Sphaerosporella brunnea TaxID=1250544 RepID=A0A5J5EJ92_9PEZI|nr:hypothetical protein FN846DRAFT_894767 [Sphaerosporella brunnea]